MLYRDEKRAGVLELTAPETRLGELPDRFCSSHRIERARNELCRARPIHIVSGFGLEQLSVREDDSELIVQPMEEQPQVRVDSRTMGEAARIRPARVSTGR